MFVETHGHPSFKTSWSVTFNHQVGTGEQRGMYEQVGDMRAHVGWSKYVKHDSMYPLRRGHACTTVLALHTHMKTDKRKLQQSSALGD